MRRQAERLPYYNTRLTQVLKGGAKLMHPTKKAGRIAGAIYASMVFVGPFSLIYVPNKYH